MENYKEEIAKLQTQLDELKSKIEKPEFEAGKWYKESNTEAIYCLSEFNGLGKKCNTYGLNYKGEWMNPDPNRFLADCEFMIEATPKEVEEALNKYAEIIYKECKRVKPLWETPKESWVFTEQVNSKLFQGCFFYKNICVMKDGIWATPIKTKTIDEISKDLSILSEHGIKEYLIKEKTVLIETLNNL